MSQSKIGLSQTTVRKSKWLELAKNACEELRQNPSDKKLREILAQTAVPSHKSEGDGTLKFRSFIVMVHKFISGMENPDNISIFIRNELARFAQEQ